MNRTRRRKALLAALGLFWLVTAVVAAALDWPTPRRLAEERLQLAYLAANAVDKAFRPYGQPVADDPDVQYQQLAADFRDRFGARFDLAAVERRHAAALAAMPRERAGIVAFAAGSTAVIWWLLWSVGGLLGPHDAAGGSREAPCRGERCA